MASKIATAGGGRRHALLTAQLIKFYGGG